MTAVKLGRTGIVVNKNGFGALPIQRVSETEAIRLLQKAYDNGINFYDSARWYTDSEHKLGLALSGVRDKIIIATKTGATDTDAFWKELEISLSLLKTDYIDIYQFHNLNPYPKPGDESGLYEAMLDARRQGKIRFIGITNHRLNTAREAVESGLYDTLQFPFSYLSTEKELEIVKLCADKNVGFIAMKALSGGLIKSAAAACAYIDQFENVLPIWGVQRESELDEFISYGSNPPELTTELQGIIDSDRASLNGEFCRGCGYCMPDCPAKIHISNCARMSLLIRRSPSAQWMTEEWQAKMGAIENCTGCGSCLTHCPYDLNTPEVLKKNYKDYKEIIGGKPL